MIKRDLDEEQVTKNTIPLKKRGERSKLNSSQINMSNLTQNGVNSVKAKDGNSIKCINNKCHPRGLKNKKRDVFLKTFKKQFLKLSTNSYKLPVLEKFNIKQIGQLKNNLHGHPQSMSQEDFQNMEQIMIQDHSQFMQSQINPNTQQYYPIPQTQFPIPLKHQYQQAYLINQQNYHAGNQTQMYESQLPNINEQMNFLTQDIQNAKNISTILKEYHEGLKSHQKSKSISVNSQSTLFNKNSFQNNNTKVVLTKLIGNSDPESQIILQQESLSTGMEQTMSYNQANNTMDYNNKINKLYEEQNNQKIKSIKEILNRSMGHRVKMSNDSSVMGTSVLRQRYLRPKLPTILAKTMQFENNKKQRVVQNSQNTSQTIDKFDEISNKKFGRDQIEAKVFMNKELKKALQQKQNRYRENILSMTIKNYRNDSKNIFENQLNKDLQDSNILDNHNVSHQSSIQNLTKANIKGIDQFTSSPSQLMKHKKSISQNFTTKNLSSALSRKSSQNLKKVERESQTLSFIENQQDKQVQFNIDILKSQLSSKLQLQQANTIQSPNQNKSQNQKDQILKQKQNNINRVRVLQKTGKNTYNPNLERLILNKKLFERDSSQLKRWGQAQNNQGTEGGQLSAFINTDINLVTSSMDTSVYNSPDKLKARQSHLNQYLVQNSNLQSR
eukprot:403371747